MYCVGCGIEIAQGVNFCTTCGTSAPSPMLTAAQPTPVHATRIDAPIWLFCVVGGILGAIAGYVTRPSAMLVGQLPFGTVITDGATLQGFDQIFVPLAQQSLSQMLTGLMIGAVLGGVAGAVLRGLKSRTP